MRIFNCTQYYPLHRHKIGAYYFIIRYKIQFQFNNTSYVLYHFFNFLRIEEKWRHNEPNWFPIVPKKLQLHQNRMQAYSACNFTSNITRREIFMSILLGSYYCCSSKRTFYGKSCIVLSLFPLMTSMQGASIKPNKQKIPGDDSRIASTIMSIARITKQQGDDDDVVTCTMKAADL